MWTLVALFGICGAPGLVRGTPMPEHPNVFFLIPQPCNPLAVSSLIALELRGKKTITPVTSYVSSHTHTNTNNNNKKVGRHASSAWQQYLKCLSSDYISYVAKWAISVSPHRLIMGEVTWLTWPQLTCVKKNEITKMWVSGGLSLSESFIFLRKNGWHWQRCEITAFCNRAEAYIWRPRLVAWPDLKIKKKS